MPVINIPPALHYELRRILILSALAALLGILFARPGIFLLPAWGGLTLWHAYYLARFVRWLGKPSRPQPYLPAGVWQLAAARVNSLQRRNQKRKRRLSTFIERFQAAAAALPDALVILDKQNTVEWCNPSADKLLGMHWPLVNGLRFTDLVRLEEVTRYVEDGGGVQPLEFSPYANKGKVLSMRIVPFGKKRQRLAIVRDITRIYLLDRTRRDFVANVSHELRTPLTVINGFLENMSEDEEFPAAWERSLHLMQGQSKRMQNIIEDLLTLSALELEQDNSENEQVPVPDMLRGIVDDIGLISRETGHQVFLHCENLCLTGSAKELHSAFSNLIINAVRHTPPGSTVHITWSGAVQQGALLKVEDSGDGIEEKYIPRLTERFFRVDKGRSRATGGTGLGLAIVKHVLKRHHAFLSVTSEAGRGSCFSCHFPASVVSAALPASKPAAHVE